MLSIVAGEMRISHHIQSAYLSFNEGKIIEHFYKYIRNCNGAHEKKKYKKNRDYS